MKLKYNYDKLKGRIIEKLNTRNKYAQAIESTASLVSKKLSNKCSFTQKDISLSIKKDVLDIKDEEIGIYFFNSETEFNSER